MKDHEDRRLDIAAFRHRLLADALEANEGRVRAAIEQTAAGVHRTPDGKEVHVRRSILWRWRRLYRRGGLLALRPGPRFEWLIPHTEKRSPFAAHGGLTVWANSHKESSMRRSGHG